VYKAGIALRPDYAFLISSTERRKEMTASLPMAIRQPLETRDVPARQPDPRQVSHPNGATGVYGTDTHVLSGELPVALPWFSYMSRSMKSIRLVPCPFCQA
jgi:hypothetical protein